MNTPLVVPGAEEQLLGSTQLSKASQEHPHGQGRTRAGLEHLGHWGLSFPENLGTKGLRNKRTEENNHFFSYQRKEIP